MTHEIKIEPIMERTPCCTLSHDGQVINGVTAYGISQKAGDYPEVTLEMACNTSISFVQDCNVKVSNKREIATVMDESEFKEFCDIWHEVHKQ